MRTQKMNIFRGESISITTATKHKKTLISFTLVWMISLFFFGLPSSWKDNLSSVYQRSSWMSRNDFTGSNKSNRADSAVDFTDNPSSAIGVFILFDSTKLGSNMSIETLVKWPELDAVLAECKNSPDFKTYRIYLIFYSSDSISFPVVYQTDFIVQLNKTLGWILTNGSVEQRVTVVTKTLSNRAEDSRLLNDIIREAYLKKVDYFYVIPSNRFLPGTTHQRKDMKQMRDILIHDSEFSNLGVVVQASREDTIMGLFFSKIHVEIFGETFSYDLPTLSQSLDFLAGLYPKNLTHCFSDGKRQGRITLVNSSLDHNESNPLVIREKRTLKRYLDAVTASPNHCLRCDIKNSHNVIAMSLYGSDYRYTMGAIRNAQLLPVIFPKWRLWFYSEFVEKGSAMKFGRVPEEITDKLKELGAEIRYIDPVKTGLAPMLWRFLAAADSEVEIFTVRDSDSRLTTRDAAVVADWLKTDKVFHCIRDHPSHSLYAVSGGLWGGRRAGVEAVLKGNMTTLMKKYGAGYVEDMNFLGGDIWPKVKDNHTYCHDSFSCQTYPSSHPFPVKREEFEHLGQVYDEHSIGRQVDINILRSSKVNENCVPT